jgi:hypothetical protein
MRGKVEPEDLSGNRIVKLGGGIFSRKCQRSLNFVASELLDKKACAFFVAGDLRTRFLA